MSGYRYGCGAKYPGFVPRGYGYREVTFTCGTTATDGGVNQCDKCAASVDAGPLPDADESDMDHFERINADE